MIWCCVYVLDYVRWNDVGGVFCDMVLSSVSFVWGGMGGGFFICE